jgi:hypothetical protein
MLMRLWNTDVNHGGNLPFGTNVGRSVATLSSTMAISTRVRHLRERSMKTSNEAS